LESVLKAASVAGSSTADEAMVLISGAGNTTVVFWSTSISTRL
jgi:hypothetical protein